MSKLLEIIWVKFPLFIGRVALIGISLLILFVLICIVEDKLSEIRSKKLESK